MFKSLGADLMGTADNCTPIPREKFSDAATVADSLSFLIPGEKPIFFLKSKIKEFIFTDIALIFLERDNAAGVKRHIRRYEYYNHLISNVEFETPGVGATDYACEIRFDIMGPVFTGRMQVDVVKSEVDAAKKYYAAIILLANRQAHMKEMYNTAINSRVELRLADQNVENVGKVMVASTQAIVTAFCPRSYGEVLLEALKQ